MPGISGQPRHVKTTTHDARASNLRTALELVSRHGATSRAEIARRTGLSRTAVSSLVGQLIDERLLVEKGPGQSAGGKPPTLLALNGRAREAVVLNLGHHPFQAALIDLVGNIRNRIDAPVEAGVPTGPAALEVATLMIEEALSVAEAPVIGIGIGSPGVITKEGLVMEASNLAWHGVDVAGGIGSRFRLPVTIANDAAMAALAEYRRHPAERNLILMKLGRGVGAGLVIDGALYRGQHAAAGEIGHVRATEPGRACSCGRYGCLETVASIPSILRAGGANPDTDPWDTEALSARYGRDNVVKALRDAGTAIGAALAGVVATIDIGHVVLAPEMVGAGAEMADAVAAELSARVLPELADLIDVDATDAGSDLVLNGAAAAVYGELLGAVL